MDLYNKKITEVKSNQYIITYDLKDKDSQTYQELDNFINEVFDAEKTQDSVWIIKKSNTTSEEIFNQIMKNIKKDDKILVAEVNKLKSN